MNELQRYYLRLKARKELPVKPKEPYQWKYCDKCDRVHFKNYKCEKPRRYKDYLKAQKPVNPEHLAPATARTKYSKGDNPRYRFKKETTELHKKRAKVIDLPTDKHLSKTGYRLQK